MSVKSQTLRALIIQARMNAQILTALSIAIKNIDLGQNAEKVIDLLQSATNMGSELVEALNSATAALGDETNG